MANIPEKHPEMMTLDGLYEQVRRSLISGTPDEQRTFKAAFLKQLDYTLDAAAVLIPPLFEDEEPAEAAPVQDATAAFRG
jgi:hypothetical protein